MTNHIGNDGRRHPVLESDQETVRLQIGLDEFGMPARVVGLGH